MKALHAVVFALLTLVVSLPLSLAAGGAPPTPAGAGMAASAPALAPEDFQYVQIDYPNAQRTAVFGINSEGTIVGRYSVYATGPTWRGFMLQDMAFSDIYYPGSTSTTAWGINSRGDVAGSFIISAGPKSHAFVLADGEFTEITIDGGIDVYAYDIDDSGMVLGRYQDAITPGPWINFLWRNGEYTTLAMPAVAWAEALGLNNRGEVVGHFVRAGDNTNHMIGFLLSKGTFTAVDYPEPNAMACLQGIGNTGEAVGHVQLGAVVFGTIWRKGQFSATLRFPGANATYPHDMAPNGIVAGYFNVVAGFPHGFIARQIK